MVGSDLYYGVFISPDLLEGREVSTVYTDKKELMQVLKEFKEARFKVFRSEVEAVDFATSFQPVNVPKVKL